MCPCMERLTQPSATCSCTANAGEVPTPPPIAAASDGSAAGISACGTAAAVALAAFGSGFFGGVHLTVAGTMGVLRGAVGCCAAARGSDGGSVCTPRASEGTCGSSVCPSCAISCTPAACQLSALQLVARASCCPQCISVAWIECHKMSDHHHMHRRRSPGIDARRRTSRTSISSRCTCSTMALNQLYRRPSPSHTALAYASALLKGCATSHTTVSRSKWSPCLTATCNAAESCSYIYSLAMLTTHQNMCIGSSVMH